MNAPIPPLLPLNGRRWVGLLARVILGVVFISLGLQKAANPAEFLKAVHGYGWWHGTPLLSWVAALLPWIEVVCGLLLLIGLRVRGAAFIVFGMLVVFSALVLQRALPLHQTTGIPFCGLRFDCGCGNGEVPVCRKLIENSLLLAVAGVAYAWRRPGS